MLIDFHSHILPGMDDGASDTEESIKLLEILRESNVDTVVLTPHFYRREEEIHAFLTRREKAFRTLSEALSSFGDCPGLLKGAEVYFYPSLSSDPDFYKLCTENTSFILLELPFQKFDDNFFRSYANFLNKCEQKIVLAHIERYLRFGNTVNDIMKLFDYGEALAQMNCSSLARADFFKRKLYLKLISEGVISVLGTDTHNVSHRPPEFEKAEKIITSKCNADVFERLCIKSEMILKDKSIEEILGV